MGSLLQSRSLESDIAECHQAILWAQEPDSALRLWKRLRQLLDQRALEEQRIFLLESRREGGSGDAATA